MEATDRPDPGDVAPGSIAVCIDTDKSYISQNGFWVEISGSGSSTVADGDYGDITVSGSGATWTIDNDVVTYAKMQNVTDGRLLGRSSGSSGDVQEITVGNGLSLSGGDLSVNSSFGNFGKYHPDREPTLYHAKENWYNNTASLTWTWANQGGASETIGMDSSYLVAPTGVGDSLRVRWMGSVPGSGDFIVVAKASAAGRAQYNQGGICVLTGGTTASPTQIYTCGSYINGVSVRYTPSRFTNYTTWAAAISEYDTGVYYPLQNAYAYYLIKFTDSSNTLEFFTSQTGDVWNSMGTTVASGNITDAGIFVNSSGTGSDVKARFYWFRVLKDSTQISDPFKVGQ